MAMSILSGDIQLIAIFIRHCL